jgi:hypothetical protein
MDTGSNERASPPLPAGVSARVSRLARLALALVVAASLVAAVAAGLLRAGLLSTGLGPLALGQHAALMLSGLLGTTIAIERAVALKQRWAFLAPWASGLGSIALLAGQDTLGGWLGVFAAAMFVCASSALSARQWAVHSTLLLLGAVAWLVGNVLFALGKSPELTLPWWFAFIVLTVAAERLEMARLMRHRPAAQGVLLAILLSLLAGAALTGRRPLEAGVLYGCALAALALWLLRFDIARRTLQAHGLARYMAVSLLVGYVWLAVAGVAWIGVAWGCPGRDWALHALGLGFIFSMVMGHAPVILPAVARVKLRFGPWFYLPLGLLHVSLLLRLPGSLLDPSWRSAGTALNAAALALFVMTLAGSALAWHRPLRETPRCR